MGVNKNRMQRKRENMQRRGSGGLWRPKEGKNIIRVFLYDHKVTKKDLEIGNYTDDDGVKAGKTVTEIDREVAKHFFDGNHGNCDHSKKCGACSDARKLLESGSKTDTKAGKMLNPRFMHHVNLMDIQDKDSGVQLGSLPKTGFEPILDVLLDDEDGGEEAFGCNGVDFIITKDKTKRPSEQYSVRPRDRSKCKNLDESLANDVKDLMAITELDPGFGMGEYDAEFDEDDEEKTDKKDDVTEDEEKPTDDDEGDEDDDGDGNKNEEEKHELIGKTVSFKGEGKKREKGVVKDVEDDIALVIVGKDEDEWEVNIDGDNLKVIDKK